MVKFYLKSILLTAFVSALFFNSLKAQTVGLITHDSGSDDDGYVLFTPMLGCDTTFLIDKCGRRVHTWVSNYGAGLDVYLLPDGSLLRPGYYPDPVFAWVVGSDGGIIQRFSWDGTLLWQYVVADSMQTENHDIYPMPNGDILVAVWEVMSHDDAVAAGRDPGTVNSTLGLWLPKVMELKPIGTDSAQVVWQWRLSDHLVQNYDNTKANYGVVSDHPELMNFNYINTAATDSTRNPDWQHLNQVTYNAALDQVMISFHCDDEIFILDHSTTTAQAATHSGGVHNKGGDFLYRWGNPAAYGRGTIADNKLFQQHDPEWVTTGKYANQIRIFNNGIGRGIIPSAYYSSVDIINPPMDSAGNYYLAPGAAYGPDSLSWSYYMSTSYYSAYMGGAQTLDNGNMLICSAIKGIFLEIDSNKNIVWQYRNPINNGITLAQGAVPDSNSVYRCTFYPSSYSGFAGHSVEPGTAPLEKNPLPYTCSLGSASVIAHSYDVKVYPNPAYDLVHVEGYDMNSVTLTDITGRTVVSKRYYNAAATDISVRSLPTGVYILCVNGTNYSKLAVQH